MENMLFGGRKKIRKIGGSLTISLPMAYFRTRNIEAHDMVDVWFDSEKVIINLVSKSDDKKDNS